MTDVNFSLKPSEINLDLIPIDWPLTPVSANKNPYIKGWSENPCDKKQIQRELDEGRCKAIGLIAGPVYNEPYGLIWVDIDGPLAYKIIEKLSGKKFDEAMPPTLSIQSGREGRERRLYKVNKENQLFISRKKYIWSSSSDFNSKDKLEILWKNHQGILMGGHPQTDGYFTKENLGFEWATKLPELPDWLIFEIEEKNKKQGNPTTKYTRAVSANSAINLQIDVEREMQTAKEALAVLPVEVADDYDQWIKVGQALHSLDDCLLDVWHEWSSQSDKYREASCNQKWQSFSRDGGVTIGSLYHLAKQYGYQTNKDYEAMAVSDEMIEQQSQQSLLMEDIQDVASHMLESLSKAVGSQTQDTFTKKQKIKKSHDEPKVKNPTSSELAEYILGYYNGNLVYSEPHGQFFMYGRLSLGLWSPLTELEMQHELKNLFSIFKTRKKEDEHDAILPNGYSFNLVTETYKHLQSMLLFKDWYDDKDHLLFANGVLSLQTLELIPFDNQTRDLYINQQLPYEYDPNAKCDKIINWLSFTQWGSNDRVQVLRAWLRATLLGAYDLQKFVEIIGPGKSGKSTYASLCVALVGKENIHASDFENLERGRFEAGAYMGKKLIVLQDQDRWGGSVAKLKAITGGDWIRPERKYQKDIDAFQFHGVVMITANEAIQSTDYTSGLGRRRLTIPFDRAFEGNSKEQRELIKFNANGDASGEFAFELPGLVNWLLQMPEEDMREYLLNSTAKSSFFKRFEMEQRVSSNPILDWMESSVVWERNATSKLGIKKQGAPGDKRRYLNADMHLYPSYCEFCDNAGVNSVGRKRFQLLLVDIIRNQLKLPIVNQKSSGGVPGRFIHVAVRQSNEKRYTENYPSIIEVAANQDHYQDSLQGLDRFGRTIKENKQTIQQQIM
tara:strand:- start:6713 stop:9403 length:2691 start_codon:yes stop_codon:yes gene_type:complete